jgi:hypothetical protein
MNTRRPTIFWQRLERKLPFGCGCRRLSYQESSTIRLLVLVPEGRQFHPRVERPRKREQPSGGYFLDVVRSAIQGRSGSPTALLPWPMMLL